MKRTAIRAFVCMTAVMMVLSSCSQECLVEEINPSFTIWEVEGEVTANRVLVDEWSTNINLISISTSDGIEDFELSGKPDLIEIGESYHVTLFIDPDNPNSTDTGNAALFGPSGCTGAKNTIQVLDADGSASAVELPSPIPDSPISLRQFLLGFGAFSLVLFIFRHK